MVHGTRSLAWGRGHSVVQRKKCCNWPWIYKSGCRGGSSGISWDTRRWCGSPGCTGSRYRWQQTGLGCLTQVEWRTLNFVVPLTCKLCKNGENIDLLEEVNIDVRDPEFVYKLDVNRDVGIILWRWRTFYSWLQPSRNVMNLIRFIFLRDTFYLTPKYIENETVNFTSSISRICNTSRSTLT